MTEAKREALWLAQKMGNGAGPYREKNRAAQGWYEVCAFPDGTRFSPHANKWQFAECLLWAAKNGLSVRVDHDEVSVYVYATMANPVMKHDGSDASIMAATLTAICRASGYQGE